MGSSILFGWISVIIACFCFGSFAVPMKSQIVKSLNIDPLVYQTYKSVWCFLTAWLILTYVKFQFTWWGIISAIFWVPAGTAAVVAVKNVGVAVGQAIWSSLIVLVSTIWGFVIFHEKIVSIPLVVAGYVLLVCGLIGMAFFSVPKAKQLHEIPYSILQNEVKIVNPTKHEILLENSFNDDDYYKALQSDSNSESHDRDFIPNYWVGISAAVFNGLWGGSVLAPLSFKSNDISGIDYLLSFGIGVGIVTSFMWILYAALHRFYWHRPLPLFHIQQMLLPGSISGMLWCVGNLFSMLAIINLGQAIGYSSCQASMLISGLWGLLYYKEITGVNGVLWSTMALLATSGIVCLAYETSL